ncbi:MAG: endolytic transglycosylase MltG, partial [Flavobacteriales bacterium]|nr:endolytic transglycosylase MltG [Flavobacteriales bacterium]
YGWGKWRLWFGPGARFAEDRFVRIPSGAGLVQAMVSLRSAGVLADERAFRLLARQKKYTDRVRPGRYRITGGMSMNALVNKLRAGEQDPVRVTFNNIQRLPQLAGRLAHYLEPDSLAFLHAFNDPDNIHASGLDAANFIGAFLPDTYELWWTTTPAAFLARMQRERTAFWTDERTAKARAFRLSPAEVTTLASIVQAETMRMDDAPKIAGVYLNRLRIGMPLQADPTLKFALGLDSIRRVLDRDKLVDSPYNTYRHAGLPPGPINMPAPRFIDAVLNAPRHDHLYFCAKADMSGYSEFSRTYEQHLVHARRYQRALNERGIRR